MRKGTRWMHRFLAGALVAAALSSPPLRALGEGTPEVVVEVPEPDDEPVRRRSVCQWFTLGTLFFSVTTACMAVLLPPATVVEPMPPAAGFDFPLKGMDLVPAGLESDDLFSWPSPSLPARTNASTTFGSDDLPGPRTFRLVRHPDRIPRTKALRAFAGAACSQWAQARAEAAWAVSDHWKDQQRLVEGHRRGLDLPALRELEADEETSRRIADLWIHVREVLGRQPCVETWKDVPRGRNPHGEDREAARAVILAMEAELNALNEEFLDFAREVISRDPGLEPPGGTRTNEVVAAARSLKDRLAALERARIGR